MSSLNRFLPALAGAVAGGAVALAVGGGDTRTTRTITATMATPPAGSVVPTSISEGSGMTVNEIAKRSIPGVVDIKVSTVAPVQLSPFGPSASQSAVAEGAGAVYDAAGHVLTDEHVVAGATAVRVQFSDGRSYSASVVGTDKSTDIGVIKVNAPASELHPLPLADSTGSRVGDGVVAIGSPFGLPYTVTTGIVSATGRSIQAPNHFTITGAIQTDAAINQGNSGGPLIDSRGRVLGLNDQIETNSGSNAGVGFAVPSNTVKRVADAIIAGQPVRHSYLGVELSPAGQGATVSGVAAGGPAAGGGLQPGDQITALDGVPVASTDQFISRVDNLPPGRTITLTVQRNGSSRQVNVTLGDRPSG